MSSIPRGNPGALACRIPTDFEGGRHMTLHAAARRQLGQDPIVPFGRIPIYLQEWWWDIASGGQHKLIASYEGEREVGRIFYFPRIRNFMGLCNLTEGVHAPWTNYCAPTMDCAPDDPSAMRQGEIAYDLARQLPRSTSYRLTCPHVTPDPILGAFKRVGFAIGTQRSYLVDLRGAGIDRVIAHLDMSTRQRYRKAEKKLDIVEIAPSMFFKLYRCNLTAQGKISYHDLSIAERLASTCWTREPRCIRITAAKRKNTSEDDSHSYQAAIACLQDGSFSYYWMSTRNTSGTDSDIKNGAVKSLIVDAIAHASRAGLVFDFDGTTTSGTDELYRGFRATEVNRYILTRRTIPARAIEIARKIVSNAIPTRTGLRMSG